jgi:hypothetical protein
MPQQNQEKGTGELATGAGLTAFGAANAPVLRGGSKNMSHMQRASPKKQGGRYQAELHQAMKAGKVPTDSTVHVLRTPSGRHINAGGTHRQIAREAMGKPSKYEIKDISHEMHVSPAQKLKGKLQIAGLARGSRRAEAGKKVKPVGTVARSANRGLAAAADAGDAHVWKHPSILSHPVKLNRKANLISAGMIAGAGALTAGVGAHKHHEWKKSQPVHKSSVSAFGIDHGISDG